MFLAKNFLCKMNEYRVLKLKAGCLQFHCITLELCNLYMAPHMVSFFFLNLLLVRWAGCTFIKFYDELCNQCKLIGKIYFESSYHSLYRLFVKENWTAVLNL